MIRRTERKKVLTKTVRKNYIKRHERKNAEKNITTINTKKKIYITSILIKPVTFIFIYQRQMLCNLVAKLYVLQCHIFAL